MRSFLLPLALAGALAACGSEPGAPTGENMTAEEVAEELGDMKIEPGQWEATNEILSVKAAGVPADALKSMIGQKTQVSNCITPEQASKPSANFLAAQQNSNCTYQDWRMDDGKMTGTMTCQGGDTPGTVVMKMTGDYGPSAYNLDMDMNTTGLPGGLTMTIQAKTTGRRVGECTAS